MPSTERRNFLKTAGAALATPFFTGRVLGANDKLSVAFIGMGKMGRSNLNYAMKQENVTVPAVCDVYQRNLDWATDYAKQHGSPDVKSLKDFREILADKSVDAVCISTPDHWHAYMTVEACKAGKDVYVEKPISLTIEEGKKMVQAARKYNRVVQAGTMQRSADHFQKAAAMVRSGELGKVAFVRTWNYGNSSAEGYGNPPDTDPPPTLDWNSWLGPAPLHAFNANRFGVDPKDKYFSTFRWFWDYAGGMMTDWGVHWLDIVQLAFDEAMPKNVSATGGKFWITDNRETPDTLQVTYEYPGFIATYENRDSNSQSMFGKSGGILFCGTKATLFVDRAGYQVIPERGSDVEPSEVKSTSSGNLAHWANFIQCIKTRQRPTSDIEKCFRSTSTCLLGNIALRSRVHLDWNDQKQTIAQPEARKYMSVEERKPWKIVV
ncbi:MAG: Gfo/Idh/MocA family oxidoreductase [Acidobacteriota bacterium]|nr:Gfo/Idh/MocA family oxidoreductase [Acidobacteriota bacterium]